jgi:hypothetical protein
VAAPRKRKRGEETREKCKIRMKAICVVTGWARSQTICTTKWYVSKYTVDGLGIMLSECLFGLNVPLNKMTAAIIVIRETTKFSAGTGIAILISGLPWCIEDNKYILVLVIHNSNDKKGSREWCDHKGENRLLLQSAFFYLGGNKLSGLPVDDQKTA